MEARDSLALALLRLADGVCPRLPAGLGYGLAGWSGQLEYWLGGRAVGGLRANLRHVLGERASPAQLERVVSQAARNMVKNYYDLFRLAAADIRHILDLIECTGWEHLQAAQALGRGIVMASAHYGNMELMMQAVRSYGVPILAVAEHIKPEPLYAYMVELRGRHGLRFIPADGPLLAIYRALRRGEAVGLALDRDTTDSGVRVPFLGAPARLPDGYARLVAHTRAPLLIGFARRLPGERMVLDVRPPYVPSQAAGRQAVYEQALECGVQALARAVSAYPDQWVLTTPIWNG